MACRWVISLDGGPRRVNHASVIIDTYIYMFGGYCMHEHENYDDTQPIDVHVLNTRKFYSICNICFLIRGGILDLVLYLILYLLYFYLYLFLYLVFILDPKQV